MTLGPVPWDPYTIETRYETDPTAGNLIFELFGGPMDGAHIKVWCARYCVVHVTRPIRDEPDAPMVLVGIYARGESGKMEWHSF